MVQKIGFIKNRDYGRYLQSLDSVRYLESDKTACEAQAKVEILTSLMLGRTVPIGEHQFIDSFGFLNNASDLLKALDEFSSSDREQVEHIFPFQLFFRTQYKTVDGLIANKLGDPSYKLSLWTSLSQPDDEKIVKDREKIRKRVIKGKFKYEDDDLVPLGDKKAARMLRKIRDYFYYGEKEQIFTLYGAKTVGFAPYIGLLETGISKLCSWTEEDLNVQIEYQKELVDKGFFFEEVLEEDKKDAAIELIEKFAYLRDLGLNYGNRSDIRQANISVQTNGKKQEMKCQEIIDNDLQYYAILEVFDSLYNSTIAKSCSAHSESVSSARSITDNEYISAAISLATMVKNEITDQSELEGNYFNPSWIHDLSFNLGSSSRANDMLESMPWRHVWEAYLDCKWRKSVSNLNNVLNKWDNLINNPTSSVQKYMDITHEMDEAYKAHFDNVSRILAPSGWSFAKDEKTNNFVVEFLPIVGGALTGGVVTKGAVEVAKLIIGAPNIDPFWEETGIGIAAGLGATKATQAIEKIGKWKTEGYIRKTFARLVNPKG